jgi:hypothetical protein
VGDRHLLLGGDQRSAEGRVGVPVDEHRVRLLLGDERLEPGHDRRGHHGVAARPGRELVVGRRHVELLEEDLGEPAVVVLAGVDEDLLVALAQVARHRGRLHELGPVADHGQDPHGRASCPMQA